MTAAAPLTDAQLAHARHESRTPVNAIIGYSEMLLEDVDCKTSPGPAAVLGCIQELGKHLQAAITDYLDPARWQAERPLDAEVLKGELIQSMLQPAKKILEETLTLSRQTADPAVLGLVADLEKIATATRRLLELLVDPFQDGRLPTESSSHEQALPGEPTAASLSDPAPWQQSHQLLSAQAYAVPAAVQRPDQFYHGHILVVDDNQFNREILARGLYRKEHHFAVASNGRMALEMLEAGAFDLVLLDIMMPEMDGFEVLRRLKADARLKHVPVVMISALDQIDSVVRCIEMGAEDYLPKPFNPVLLNARVGACLEKKRLRDLELEYLRNVAEVTGVAADVEAGTFRPDALSSVAQRPDSLGQLARVFQSMVREVQAREERLKMQVEQLRVEIDEGRKARQVAEITETDYFQELQKRAQALKGRQRPT